MDSVLNRAAYLPELAMQPIAAFLIELRRLKGSVGCQSKTLVKATTTRPSETRIGRSMLCEDGLAALRSSVVAVIKVIRTIQV